MSQLSEAQVETENGTSLKLEQGGSDGQTQGVNEHPQEDKTENEPAPEEEEEEKAFPPPPPTEDQGDSDSLDECEDDVEESKDQTLEEVKTDQPASADKNDVDKVDAEKVDVPSSSLLQNDEVALPPHEASKDNVETTNLEAQNVSRIPEVLPSEPVNPLKSETEKTSTSSPTKTATTSAPLSPEEAKVEFMKMKDRVDMWSSRSSNSSVSPPKSSPEKKESFKWSTLPGAESDRTIKSDKIGGLHAGALPFSESAYQAIKGLQQGKGKNFASLRVSTDQSRLEVEHVVPCGYTEVDVKKMMNLFQPRFYIIRGKKKTAFLYFCPEDTPAKEKMLYTSIKSHTLEFIRKELNVAVHVKLEFNSLEDITTAALEDDKKLKAKEQQAKPHPDAQPLHAPTKAVPSTQSGSLAQFMSETLNRPAKKTSIPIMIPPPGAYSS